MCGEFNVVRDGYYSLNKMDQVKKKRMNKNTSKYATPIKI